MQEEKVTDIPEIKLTPVEPVQATTPPIVVNNSMPSKRRGRGFIKITLLAVLVVIVLLAVAIGVPGFAIYGKVKVLNSDYNNIKAAFKKQDIAQIKTGMSQFKIDLASLQGPYNLLSWTKFVPIVGGYWKDGDAAIKGGLYGLDAAQTGIETAEPYADIIGFTADSSKKAKNGEESANDRIEFIVRTIKDVIPKIETISQKAKLAQTEFDKIDPNRYPEKIGNQKVRENIKAGLNLVDEATQVISQSKPFLAEAPYFLGVDGTRTYLVLFQNDKELRPTGGFITGYSVMRVTKGKIEPVASNDIYNMDKLYTPSIPAPDPLIRYLKGPYQLNKNFRLRDMNFNPDFKLTMDLFTKEAAKTGTINNIDGVIAVDTQVLAKILNVIGEVGVPGYGNFNTKIVPECNCPQVIHELESFADIEGSIVWDQNDPTKIIFAPPNYLNRKAIVGPLMNSVLRNALGQPKEKLPGLFQAAWESLTEKHVLFYMFDPKAQAGVESFNIAGRVEDYKNGDYFLVTDANLGGRKSNLYVTNEVTQDVKIARDGSITKTVVVTYKNPQSYDGWLNSVLPDWMRIYVPKGSQLISIDGLEEKADPYEDLGKTVFAGGFKLRPQGVVKITVVYKLPFKATGEYKLLIQKQPGLDAPLYSVTVGRSKDEGLLKTDKEYKFKI